MKKKRFQKIYIEIINRCNLCCSFCPTSDRPARMMSVDEFEKVAAQAAPFTDYICLHVKGEPMMHPWLGDILSIAHQNGLKVNLTTNAVLLPEKQQLLLGETAPRQISLSLHSFDANIMHDRNFRSYLENAIDFARTFTLTSPGYISFRLWNLDGETTRGQNAQNDVILETLASFFPRPWVQNTWGFRLCDRVFVHYAEKFDWPDLALEERSDCGTCRALKDQIAVLSDGTVVPCCLDHEGDIALGNLFSQNLPEILDDTPAKSLLSGFSARKLSHPLCRRCGYAKRFR